MKSDFAAAPWESVPTTNSPTINPKQIQGLWIPREYLFSKNLSYPEKLLMAFIRMLDQENHCYASNRYLGELLGVSERTIANMIVTLKKKNLIKQVSWNGTRRVLKCI
jgi:DNA-binding MarR family transcriptional regulator